MRGRIYRSPAKVNLYLRVLGKRDDGFHDIETKMAPISLYDTLRFTPSDSLELLCSEVEIPTDDTNLVIKAVRLLEKYYSREFKYKIGLEKKIPHGAGLAGGSSNAATTLMAINEMEELGLSRSKLAELASEIGSDVAFFIYEAVAICTGRGEVVSPQKEKIEADLLLFKPQFGVNTPSAYQAWASSKELATINYSPQKLNFGSIVNDLERPVFEKHRYLAVLKMWLLEQEEVHAAMLTGSGSTVFSVMEKGNNSHILKEKILNTLDRTLSVYEVKII